MRSRWAFPAALLLLVLAADRLTKLWAYDWLRLQPQGEFRLMPFLYLTYAENTGAAFSLMRNSNALLIAVSLAVLACLFYYRRDIVKDGGSRLGYWLVVAGALGNLYDRALYGHVVDFIDFRVWPVFNVADSCISVGAALLALILQRQR